MARLGLTALLVVIVVHASGLAQEVEKSDSDILRAARLSTDAADLAKYLQSLPLGAAQQTRATLLIAQLGDPVYARREAAEEQLTRLLPGAVPALRTALRSSDPEIVDRAQMLLRKLETEGVSLRWRAAARLLARQPPATAVEAILSILPLCYDDTTEEEVLTALVRVAGTGEKLAGTLPIEVDDPDPARRGAVALLLGRGGSSDQRKRVQGLLSDPVPMVRLRAAQGLLAGRDRSGLNVLVQIIREGTPEQARQASDQLTALAGVGGVGSIEIGTPPQRAALAKSWETWVQNTGRQLDLARAEVDFGSLNRTLTALQLSRRFLGFAEAGNIVGITPLIGFPYAHLEANIAPDPQELANIFSNQGIPAPPRGELLPTTRIQSLDALVRGGNNQGVRNVLARHPRDELIAVESVYRYPNNPTGSRATVFVRVPKAGAARVVGYTYVNFDWRRPGN